MVWFEAHFCNLGLSPLNCLVCILGGIRWRRHLIYVVSTFRNVIERSIQPLFSIFGGKSFILGLDCGYLRRLVVTWEKHWRRTTACSNRVCQKGISCCVVGALRWIALKIDCVCRRTPWYFHGIILCVIQIVICAINISWIKVFKESCSSLYIWLLVNRLRWSLTNCFGCCTNQKVTCVGGSHSLITGRIVVAAANRGRRNRGLLL